MKIKGTITGDTETAVRIAGFSNKLYQRLVTVITALSLDLQSYVKQRKLSGQVLRNRSGTLRRSINRTVTQTPSSVRARVGTNVVYARRHELGFSGTETVKVHLRQIKQAWGRPLAEPKEVSVRSFTRKVNYPARSFLRSALEDKRADIITRIGNVVKEMGGKV